MRAGLDITQSVHLLGAPRDPWGFQKGIARDHKGFQKRIRKLLGISGDSIIRISAVPGDS